MKTLPFIARVFVCLIFLLSGVLKIIDPATFLLDIQAFDVFPYAIAYLFSLLVPSMEVVCALALWSRAYRCAATMLLSLMTLGFIALIGYEAWQGLNLNCGCFGNWLLFPNFYTHIGFNCFLLAALLVNTDQKCQEN